jgi:ubiquinone/menaquinone biosynthesis C-methylase UbiE
MLIRAATFLVVAAFFYLCYRLFRRYRFHFRHQCERAAAFLSGEKSRKSWLWFKTNIRCYQKGAPLHHASAWKYMSVEDWVKFVKNSIAFMEPPVTAQSNVFEVGVGVGAFSKTVSELTGCTHFAGIDPVEEAVVMARQVLPQGHFLVGNGLDLSAFDDNTFDHVLAAGVIMYLDDLEEAQQFVREMIRIAKPGGSLMVNCVSEPGGQNPGSGNIFIPKEWWSVAASGAVVTSFQDMSEWTVGQKDRYAVYLTKNASRA